MKVVRLDLSIEEFLDLKFALFVLDYFVAQRTALAGALAAPHA
jgi:hypothetical protein